MLNYFIWLIFIRTLRLMPHLWNRPKDIIYIPAFVAFGYCFEFIKLYALLTLHKVSYISAPFFQVMQTVLKSLFRLNGVRGLELTVLVPPKL